MKTYNISNLLGQSDILEIDLEQIEFDMNFAIANNKHLSMFEDIPSHIGFINFSDPDGELYGDEPIPDNDMDADDDDDNVFEDRDSYRNTNLDDVYYFI